MVAGLLCAGRSAHVLACTREPLIAAANKKLVSANLTAATRAMKRTFFGDLGRHCGFTAISPFRAFPEPQNLSGLTRKIKAVV
jgi:hypothetical protein